MFAEYKARIRIAGDKRKGTEQRIFAALELFCMPVSLLTVFALIPALAILPHCGIVPPAWINEMVAPILLSAAVGYGTNFIAIEMLFKPYYKTKKNLYAILTFGYWQQGLVPKNKDRIADEMAGQVEGKLLNPAKLAEDLCAMVSEALRNKDALQNMRTTVQSCFARHGGEIIGTLVPEIELAFDAEINRLITPDALKKIWQDQIEPDLTSDRTRGAVARGIIDSIRDRSPQIARTLRPRIISGINEHFGKMNTILGNVVGAVAENTVSNEALDEVLKGWLAKKETEEKLKEELVHVIDRLSGYLRSSQSDEKIQHAVETIRAQLRAFLHEYLTGDPLRKRTEQLLASHDLWNWIEREMLPKVQPVLNDWLKGPGTELILQKLSIKERVKSAVDKMDVKEFHDMINEVAAQHLGAIQVLGYLLGALVVILQLAVQALVKGCA